MRSDGDELDFSDELDLVAALRRNDPAAGEHLARTYGPRLLAVARRLLPQDGDAQDAVQDAFVAAFRSIHAFQGGSRLSTWLHRITVNAALLKLRSRKRRREQVLGLSSGSDSEAPGYEPEGSDVPSDALPERDEIRAIVRREIENLPESLRTALVLRDIEGLDLEEAAACLGVTTNAVKIRVHRARQRLKELLERRFGDDARQLGVPASETRARAPWMQRRVGRRRACAVAG